jgi:hypothetical protein
MGNLSETAKGIGAEHHVVVIQGWWGRQRNKYDEENKKYEVYLMSSDREIRGGWKGVCFLPRDTQQMGCEVTGSGNRPKHKHWRRRYVKRQIHTGKSRLDVSKLLGYTAVSSPL